MKVFVVHGDEESAVAFAETVKATFGFEAMAPYTGDVYDLESGLCVQEGSHS